MADLPSFLLSSCPKEHEFLVPVMKDHIDVLKIAPRILVNTVRELEIESVEKLEFLPIGPLIPSDSPDMFEKTEDDYIYIQWLNTQPKSSVVYVSFGTIATFGMEQLEEMASGLVEIGRPFLWVIREGEQAEKFSKVEELQKQGMIVGWCSQVEVLSYQAIGCVVMHCGWNSTVEVLVAGVPTVAFPQWSDQGMMRCVEMVMEGKEMKRNSEKRREVTREALKNGGPSTINLQTFLHDV
ncbi:hypothetical protein L1987_45506 [Smallanthus sonchifolius]|uniref:Uncharacterized protein n=1 Tax=Smallanthus sonchifolius TaxID=185202 RepID=A0ACB9FWY5_9ASTR|nr:hypothetical protein L1987_45506 [Smallanthus sonchifolius]